MAFGESEDEVWGALKPRFKPRVVSDPNRAYVAHMLKGTGPFAKAAPKPASGPSEARATLARVVRRTPEVLVKVTGRKHGARYLAAHLDYIGRHGKLAVETRDGERIDTKADAERIAEEWSDSLYWRKGTSVSAVAMVFSMPAGSDPETVKQAVRETAEHMIGDNHDWLMALHTDTPRPHVHLTVQSQGLDMKRFDPRREDLFRFRENFALGLRSRGIEAEATPRYTRGQGRAGASMALTQIRSRVARGEPGIICEVDKRLEAEAKAVAQGQSQQPVFVAKSRARWDDTRQRYAKAAAILETSGGRGDRELARDVREFLQKRPTIELVPEELVRRAIAKASADGLSRDESARPLPSTQTPQPSDLASLRITERTKGRQTSMSPNRARIEIEAVLPQAQAQAAHALGMFANAGASDAVLRTAQSDVDYLNHPKGPAYQARVLRELGTQHLYAIVDGTQTPLDRIRELGQTLRDELKRHDPAQVRAAMARVEQQPPEADIIPKATVPPPDHTRRIDRDRSG